MSHLSLLSTSSQVSRFPPRLRPALSSHCGALGDFITRSGHRDVSNVPYSVLLKSCVEFRSRLKKELTRWGTADLVQGAEMSLLLDSVAVSGTTMSAAQQEQITALFRNILQEKVATLQLSADYADQFLRVAAIEAIVSSTDSELDAVLLNSIFPHPKWLQVRSPFGAQQAVLPLRQYVAFDEVVGSPLSASSSASSPSYGSSSSAPSLSESSVGAEVASLLSSRLSVLLPDVDAESDPQAAARSHAMASLVGPVSPLSSTPSSSSLSPSVGLSTIVCPDLQNSTEFMRFMRLKKLAEPEDGRRATANEANRKRSAKVHSGKGQNGASSSSSSSAASGTKGKGVSDRRILPFIVPFTTLHQLGAEVASRKAAAARAGGSGGGAASMAQSSAAPANTLSPQAAMHLSSVDVEPAEALKTLLFEKLMDTARRDDLASLFSPSSSAPSGSYAAASKNRNEVVWAVLPPTTEFNMICGKRRSFYGPPVGAKVDPPLFSSAMPAGVLSSVVGDATARTMFLAHGLPHLNNNNNNTPSTGTEEAATSEGAPRARQQFGILSGARPRTFADYTQLVGPAAVRRAGVVASAAVVGRLPTASLEIIVNGSVPSVEGATNADGGSSGLPATMVVDNSLASTESSVGKVHRHVAEKCGVLGRRL